MLQLLGATSEFERTLIRNRQQEGMKEAMIPSLSGAISRQITQKFAKR
tara:strand:+ start:9676 stop:9819 length:144 start_codon:yes stop_codon:yes gene_type:complete